MRVPATIGAAAADFGVDGDAVRHGCSLWVRTRLVKLRSGRSGVPGRAREDEAGRSRVKPGMTKKRGP